MTSYFSRLIQQTGLSVGSAQQNPQSNPIGLERGFSAIEQKPLREFEQIPSEPLANDQAEVTDVVNPAPVNLDHLSNAAIPLSKLAPQPFQLIVEKDQSPMRELVKAIEIEHSSDQNVPISPVNLRTDQHGAVQSASVLPEQPTEPTSQASVTPPDRQISLQAVRAWVAQPIGNPANPQTPNVDSNPATAEMSFTEEIKPLTTPIPAQISSLSSHFQEATQSTQVRSPEAQNFILSIGTIQLTIEQPQQAVQKHQPPPPNPERVTPPSNLNSRLSRHYIRPR